MTKSIAIVAMSIALTAIAGSVWAADTISVDNASYGMGTDCDATDAVKKLCQGRINCAFRVDPSNLCQPGGNVTHLLRVSYTCGLRGKSAQFEDFKTAQLSCE
jgi:hypothetical protein